LPTAAGKTACIDIAVFALACQAIHAKRTAPRRIFFVVDRRVVVDQAHLHASSLAQSLKERKSHIVKEVADCLCALAQDDRALDVYTLRGGMYREDTWIHSPLQPTVIASTVDQVGSRLLFRGYGVSDSMKPIHAGLVGNDALILLDEAHCALPFSDTANAVAMYRAWNESLAPFRFVMITATPGQAIPEKDIERDQAEDQAHPLLGKRITASKPARLVVAEKAKGKKWREPLVAELAKQARELMAQGFKAVGVIVNRVATARELAEFLRRPPPKKTQRDELPEVVLLTGRMRPLDRDLVLRKLDPLFSGKRAEFSPMFVVATQCLEVGADLDFHALVTECASLDALRQRFGRLNRVAARPLAKAVVVIRGDQTEESGDDPVYAESLTKTWAWLNSRATGDTFDFGVAAVRAATTAVDLAPLNAPAVPGPVLLPGHLDCWVQTGPLPALDPDPAVFLHGKDKPGVPDVELVFRVDLGDNPSDWADIVSLCSPSSSEAMRVRIDLFKRWLAGEPMADDSADIEGGPAPDQRQGATSGRPVLCWAGPPADTTGIVEQGSDIYPNRTYVVSITEPDVDCLGDFPPSARRLDYGDAAFQRSRDRAVLRLTPKVIDQWPEFFPKVDAIAIAQAGIPEDDDQFEARLEGLLQMVARAPIPEALLSEWQWLARAGFELARDGRRMVEPHPGGGIVVTGKHRLHLFDPTFADEESSESPLRKVTLENHTHGVAARARAFAIGCGLSAVAGDFVTAALWHDVGKADPRFQGMLQGTSPRTALKVPLAKSSIIYRSSREREEARAVHGFPKNGRHEVISAAAAGAKTGNDLILHLITTHHGHARPFVPPMGPAPAVPAGFDLAFLGDSFRIDPSALDPAEANRTAPGRFWKFVRTHGWWGAAYLEMVFRLADQAASRAEQDDSYDPAQVPVTSQLEPAQPSQRPTVYPCSLTGLDGSNPLAFLAGLGVLRITTEVFQNPRPNWLAGPPMLSWSARGSSSIAILHLSAPVTEDSVVEFLVEHLGQEIEAHPVSLALALMKTEACSRGTKLREKVSGTQLSARAGLDWVAALISDLAPEGASQLQTVRRDYLEGNLRSVMKRTTEDHLRRSLFALWDYADGLDNQSMHWEPTEDRRHAYQWHVPTADPTRNKRGGMLGANRLAIEAWPLFLSVANGEKLATRGFWGSRVDNTTLTWPLWSCPLDLDSVASLIALTVIQEGIPKAASARAHCIFRVFRSRRILVGKTPNLTQPTAVL
jgi:CRISPR-associated endonuclease/helicase Cas3